MLGKYWVPSREELVTRLKNTIFIKAVSMGYDIIIVNMNFNPKEVKHCKDVIEVHNSIVDNLKFEGSLLPQDDFKYELEFKDFFIPLEECIRRDSLRENPIGEKIIRNTYNRYKHVIEGNI